MRHHVRCAKCDKRRVISKHPEEYFKYSKKAGEFVNKAPKCRGCGDNKFKISNWMMKRNTHAMSCNCDGYIHLTRKIFPHRRGSKYCWFRKDGTQRILGDPDFHDSQLEEYEQLNFNNEGNQNYE